MATQAATATDRAEQWEASIEPEEMLDWLEPTCPSPRKLRLFACACKRLYGSMRWNDTYAFMDVDGGSPVGEKLGSPLVVARSWCSSGLFGLMGTDVLDVARGIAHLLRDVFGNPFKATIVSIAPEVNLRLGSLIVRLAQVNLRLGSLIVRLAQGAYDERLPNGLLDPLRLAVLADALEEAGCQGEEMLAHLRSPGPHARGCWALDLLLGKS